MIPAKPIARPSNSRSAPFLILFLSEGYAAEKDFYNDCSLVFKNLITLIPLGKSSLGAFAFFSKSADLGTGISSDDANRDSAYKIYIDAPSLNSVPMQVLATQEPRRLPATIKQLTVAGVNAERIWLSSGLRTRRAVVILADYTIANNGSSAPLVFAYTWGPPIYEAVHPVDGDPDEELYALLPVIIQTTWPMRQVASGDAKAKKSAAAFVSACLLHELGHCFDLNDEHEIFESPGDVSYDLSSRLNITTLPDPLLLDQPIASLPLNFFPEKWNDFVHPSRRAGDIAVRNHPMAAPSQDAAAIAREMRTSIVALKHPSRSTGYNIPNDLTYGKTFALTRPTREEANLYEGAGLFQRKVFRAFADCVMRRPFEPWTETISASTPDEITSRIKAGHPIPFCPVCSKYVRQQLTGSSGFALDDYLPDVKAALPGECINSRLAKAFTVLAMSDPVVNKVVGHHWACIAGTQYRFETFLASQGYKYLYAVSIPEKSRSEWLNREAVKFPALNRSHAKLLFDMWCSALLQLRRKVAAGMCPPGMTSIRDYPLLGAAGVLVASGFGSLVNEIEDVPWTGVVIPTVKGLEEADMLKLQPGSIMQLWHSREAYLIGLQYVYGLIDAQQCQDLAANTSYPIYAVKAPDGELYPTIEGHSVVFLGIEGEKLLVADQNYPKSDLKYEWRDYSFWIAAQWFDGKIR